ARPPLVEKHGIRFQRVQRLVQTAGQASDPLRVALLLREAGRVYLGGLAWIKATLQSVQAGRQQPAQRNIGIATGVGGLQFQIESSRSIAPERRRDPQRGLAIIVPIDDERTAPTLRLQAPIGVDARTGKRDEGWEMRQHARQEVTALIREAVGRRWVVEDVAPFRIPET